MNEVDLATSPLPAFEPNAPERPPMTNVWGTLVERWLALPVTAEFADRRRKGAEGERLQGKRTIAALTRHMNARFAEKYLVQGVSQWATGTDETRHPPWKAILFMLRELNLELTLTGDGRAFIGPARKRR